MGIAEFEVMAKTPEFRAWISKRLFESVDEIDPIYFTDEYPRTGCKLEIVVNEERCSMRVFAPQGRILESYRPPRNEIGRWLQEWVNGLVPRLKPSDQFQDQPSLGKVD